jgi:mannose-6-phosphate isomerase-like protein (cupin superfamily)
MTFPGATAVTRLRVYDWPTADGLRGGSPHLHTASSEGYVVLDGTGVLQTLSGQGYAEHPLGAGTLLWFTPGTVHRLVNTGGDLDILVVMQNAGLPEAGDAVLTFPPDVLADPAAYANAAALPARERRDLAIEGYRTIRDGGTEALTALYRAAAVLVRDRVDGWRKLWLERALAEAVTTGDHLDELSEGAADHLSRSAVHVAEPAGPERFGMCGHLSGWTI